MKNINTNGYQKDSINKDKNSLWINSGNITMKDTKKPLVAIKLDKQGLPIGMKFMKPNEEYNFEDADSVLEIPQYQWGGLGTSSYDQIFNNAISTVAPEDNGGTPSEYDYFNDPQRQMRDYSIPNQQERGQVSTVNSLQVEPQTQAWTDQMQPQGNKIQTPESLNPTEPYNPRQRPDIQFANPYGGIDIPTSATVLGQSIENKDTLGTVASSLKLATGLGRNIVGGLGQARRNNYVMDEYRQKQNQPLYQYAQDGGEVDLSYDDLLAVNDATGVTFDYNTANRLFERDIPQQNSNQRPYQPNYGWYKDANYFDVAQEVGDTLVLNNTGRNPHNAQTIKQVEKYLQKQNPEKKIQIEYLPNLQKGGEITKEQAMTGEYLTGIDQEDPVQMQMVTGEVEAGEYYQTNQGDVAEVIGNKHTQGGEKLPMEEKDRVLSDHTKLGASQAKNIRDNFDIEVKAKHTYSDVLDKFRKKIGLDKLVKEEEGILKKLEEQESIEDENTKQLNINFLKNKLGEIKQQKEPIEEARKMLFDKLFNIQEDSKPKKEQIQEYQEGGDYIKRNEGLDYVPEGQSKNNEGMFGGVSQQQYEELVNANPWFDWNNFDPSNPQNVVNFQRQVNRKVNNQVLKEDGKLGEQTASVRIPRTVETGLQPNNSDLGLEGKKATGIGTAQMIEVPGATVERVNEEKEDVDYMNYLTLPDQYPTVPGGMESHLKSERRFDRVEPMKLDPRPYLEQIHAQSNSAMAQLEGLSPSVRASGEANILANTQKAINDAMMKIDQTNLGSYNQAEERNAMTQRMEENAGVLDNLSYENRTLTTKTKSDWANQEYFDKIQEVNLGNYQTVNALNNLNARYSDVQFNGQNYTVADAPDFKNSLEMQNAMKYYQMMLEEEQKNKKIT